MKLSFILLFILSFIFGINNLKSQGLAPLLFTPLDNAACIDTSINFDWEQKANVVNYDLQVTTVSGNYSSPVINQLAITDTEFSASVPDNDAVYFWRVRANYSNTFAYSDEFTFSTKRAGTNTLLPTEGTNCLQNPVYFEWASMPNVSSYQIQISTNGSFGNFEINNNAVTSNTFSTNLNSSYTNYFWRVRANYTSGTITCLSEWSNSSSFTTAVHSPTLENPLDNTSGVDFSTLLSWSGANGSSSYSVQVSNDSLFNNLILNVVDNNQTSLIVTLPNNYNTLYYWRVKAKSSNGCESEWSDAFKFKTRFEDVTLTSPINEADCVPVNGAELIWEQPSGVSSYRLQVSETPGFPFPVQFDISGLKSNTYTMDLPSSVTKFYWRVRAEDSTNIGNWSPSREFTSGLFSPNLVNPVNDSTETFIVTRLEWESQNSISNYNLQVSTSQDFSPENLILDTMNLADENYDIILNEYGKNYYWRVSASFTPCLSNWSETYKFTTITGTANLVFPENNATETQLSILFDWEDVKYAVNYDIEISTSPNFDVIEKGRLAVDTSLILISGLKPTTKYYWRVRVNTGISKAPYSIVRNFTTGVEPSIRPTLISPEDLAEKIPTDEIFRWFKSDKADSYEIQISNDENFTDIAVTQNNITDTTFVVSDLENYKTYSWRVRSVNSSGNSAWTEAWKFRTIAPTVTESPALESPEDGATEINHKKAELKWFEVENVSSVKGAYHLQISTTDDFEDGTVVVDTRSVYVNEHTLFNIDHTTEYFWRVRGFNEAGDGPWSDTWSFNTYDFTSVDSKEIKDVELYPNPTYDNIVSLNYNLVESGKTTVSLINTKGDILFNKNFEYQMKGSNSLEINVSNLTSGNYFVIIENNGGKVITSLKVFK